jgi:UDP-N-acetylglucosamine--N-acetylmuramyl-(pentapeptide) pyrophosphoryl-undecaprenol N-acetylglucosamine transferase
LTVFELAAVGTASLLVPFPFAVDDHQTRNAAYLVDAGAAVLIRESDLNEQTLAAALEELLASRHHLLDMARRARDLAMPNAVESVVQACLAVAENGAPEHA